MNKSQQSKRIKPLSDENKKILAQSIKIEKDKIPSHVISIINKSKFPQYKMGQKFKNMQDPLAYIQSKKIQQLKHQAFSASKSLHSEMNEILEVTKHSYKQVMTPEVNRYDFQELSKRRYNNDLALSDKSFCQQMQARSQKLKRQKYDPTDYMERMKRLNYPLKDLSNLLAKENQYFYGKKYQIENQDDVSNEKIPLTYEHIKQLKSSGFGRQFQNVEFYEYLCSDPLDIQPPFVSEFDLSTNRRINHPLIDMKFKLIQRSQQFSDKSKQLYYDFDGDMRFWKSDHNKQWQQQKSRKISNQKMMSLYMNMDISKLSINHMLRFAMKRITPWGIADYKRMKRGHRKLERDIEEEKENLVEEYKRMREEYKLLKLTKRAQRSAPPIKYVNSQAQTIYTLPDQEFDGYFKDETIVMLNSLNKLSQFRQRVLKDYSQPDKFVMVENICQDIKQLLFCILMMMLKDQKFYSPQGFSLFGYGNLVQVEDMVETQSKVLKFILHNIDKFEIEEVDNVPKSDLIKIYVQERTKNNRILEIMRGK